MRDALGLITVNKHLNLDKAMKMLQWFKQSTCPCTQHVISRGGNQWQPRPITTMPPEVTVKLATVSSPNMLKKRATKKIVTDQASLTGEVNVLQSEQTLNELCSQILKEAKQANPLKWLVHVISASNEVDELFHWKEQMKKNIDCIVTHIQTKLYTGLDELYGELYNLFMVEDEETA